MTTMLKGIIDLLKSNRSSKRQMTFFLLFTQMLHCRRRRRRRLGKSRALKVSSHLLWYDRKNVTENIDLRHEK